MPKNSEFRVIIALASLLVVLAMSFGSYYLYKHVGLEAPLEKQLNALAGVEEVKLYNDGQTYQIEAALKKVDNMQAVFQSIQKTVERTLPGKTYNLRVVDHPDSKLENFLRHMEPAVYESLANNRFIWLDEELARRTADQQLQYKMFIDSRYIYLQVEDENAYIYRVIDRNPSQNAAPAAGGIQG